MTKRAIYNVKTKEWRHEDYTGAELEEYNANVKAYEDNRLPKKLNRIREIRNQKLQETDYLGVSDNIMSEAVKTKRQEWRDIPSTYTTEEEYDLLLTKNEQRNLTHAVWSKP